MSRLQSLAVVAFVAALVLGNASVLWPQDGTWIDGKKVGEFALACDEHCVRQHRPVAEALRKLERRIAGRTVVRVEIYDEPPPPNTSSRIPGKFVVVTLADGDRLVRGVAWSPMWP